MDDYISKPIRIAELIKALSRCQPKHTKLPILDVGLAKLGEKPKPVEYQQQPFIPNSEAPPPTNPQSKIQNPKSKIQHPLDAKVLRSLRKMAGSKATEILAKIIDNYLEEAPNLLQAISDAVATEDAAALQRAAHTLRSASANLGATTLAELCKELESMGRSGNTVVAREKVPQLLDACEIVKVALLLERQGSQI
jgi:HPt (histidine-containing phosphotransfer) domain-containing protein